MKRKVVVCRCEDVTRHDLEMAIEHGYGNIEEVKRYTGFGTGPCQGKECHALVACALAELLAIDPRTIAPFTARQPIYPTPFRFFAADPAADGEES